VVGRPPPGSHRRRPRKSHLVSPLVVVRSPGHAAGPARPPPAPCRPPLSGPCPAAPPGRHAAARWLPPAGGARMGRRQRAAADCRQAALPAQVVLPRVRRISGVKGVVCWDDTGATDGVVVCAMGAHVSGGHLGGAMAHAPVRSPVQGTGRAGEWEWGAGTRGPRWSCPLHRPAHVGGQASESVGQAGVMMVMPPCAAPCM
jgi:hypothetical protein